MKFIIAVNPNHLHRGFSLFYVTLIGNGIAYDVRCIFLYIVLSDYIGNLIACFIILVKICKSASPVIRCIQLLRTNRFVAFLQTHNDTLRTEALRIVAIVPENSDRHIDRNAVPYQQHFIFCHSASVGNRAISSDGKGIVCIE